MTLRGPVYKYTPARLTMGCLQSAPTVASSVQRMREVIATLQGAVAHAEQQQADLRTRARQALRAGRRDTARHYLHRARQHDAQINALHARILACTQKVITLQSMHMAAVQLRALKQVTRTFRGFTRQHDLDRVEALQAELEDGMEHVLEVADVLYDRADSWDVDADDLDAELNELCADTLSLPLAPTDEPRTSDIPLPTHGISNPRPTHEQSHQPFRKHASPRAA